MSALNFTYSRNWRLLPTERFTCSIKGSWMSERNPSALLGFPRSGAHSRTCAEELMLTKCVLYRVFGPVEAAVVVWANWSSAAKSAGSPRQRVEPVKLARLCGCPSSQPLRPDDRHTSRSRLVHPRGQVHMPNAKHPASSGNVAPGVPHARTC